MMLRNGATPIMRKITSMKNLSPCQRERLNRLKGIFRKEGRIPLGTSTQEIKYLYKLEAGRRLYWWRRQLSPVHKKRTPEERKSLKELDEALKEEYPPWDELTIEEELASLPKTSNEQDKGPEK